jgi:hypothetical protein
MITALRMQRIIPDPTLPHPSPLLLSTAGREGEGATQWRERIREVGYNLFRDE